MTSGFTVRRGRENLDNQGIAGDIIRLRSTAYTAMDIRLYGKFQYKQFAQLETWPWLPWKTLSLGYTLNKCTFNRKFNVSNSPYAAAGLKIPRMLPEGIQYSFKNRVEIPRYLYYIKWGQHQARHVKYLNIGVGMVFAAEKMRCKFFPA